MTAPFAAPSGPPLDARCRGVGAGALSVEWSKPRREARNGVIRGYAVRYYPTTLCYGEGREGADSDREVSINF